MAQLTVTQHYSTKQHSTFHPPVCTKIVAQHILNVLKTTASPPLHQLRLPMCQVEAWQEHPPAELQQQLCDRTQHKGMQYHIGTECTSTCIQQCNVPLASARLQPYVAELPVTVATLMPALRPELIQLASCCGQLHHQQFARTTHLCASCSAWLPEIKPLAADTKCRK
jgi:hypothetical protein